MRTNRETGAALAPELTRVRRVDQLPGWLRGDLPERVRALDLEQWAKLVGTIIVLSQEVSRLPSIRDEQACALMRRDLVDSLEAVAFDLSSGEDLEEWRGRRDNVIADVAVQRAVKLTRSLSELPAVEGLLGKLSAAGSAELELQASDGSPAMAFRDPLNRLIAALDAEGLALMQMPVEDALAAHEKAWLEAAMLDDGLRVDIPLEPPLRRLVEVDVYATEDELVEQFRAWLRVTKQKHPDAVQARTYGPSHFQKWAEQGLVPYRMAMLWAEVTLHAIPWSVAADLIGESYGDAVSDAYARNVTLRNSNVVFSDSTLNTLRAQVLASVGRK